MDCKLLQKAQRYIALPLFAFIAHYTLAFHNNGLGLQTGGMINALIFALLLFLFSKADWNIKSKPGAFVTAIIFSLLSVVGAAVHPLRDDPYSPIIRTLFAWKTSVYIAGYIIIFFALISIALSFAERHTLVSKIEGRMRPIWVFVISFAVIVLCWIPVWLSEYPAVFASDSKWIFDEIEGLRELTNHHPVLYTAIMAACYLPVKALTGSVNAGVAAAAVLQMLVMAAIFAWSVRFMYTRRVKTAVLIATVAFFALVPHNSLYSVTLWKDVPFAGVMILFTIQVIKLYEKRETLGFRDLIPFMIVTLFALLLRNNTLYMLPFLIAFMIVVFKKKRKQLISAFAAVIALIFIINGPVFNLLGIKKSSSAEYIAVPLQQIARVTVNGLELTEEEKELIDELIPLEVLTTPGVYRPTMVDTIKFNANYNADAFNENKLEYLKLWAKLVIRHPLTAVDAYCTLTLGYWYPIHCLTAHRGVWANEIGVAHEGLDIPFIDDYIEDFVEWPLLSSSWDLALWIWIGVFLAYVTARKKGWRALGVFVPTGGLWLTLMVATPIFAENRYMYTAFVLLPLFAVMPDIMPDTRITNKEGKND